MSKIQYGFNAIIRHASLLTLILITSCSSESSNFNLPEYSLRFDPGRDPFADSRAAIKLAASSNRRIIIEVGGDWCRWCRAMQRIQKENADIRRQINEHFVVLKVNYSDDNENEAFISSLPESWGFPKLYVSDNDGTILHVQDTSKFVLDDQYSLQRIREFLNKWKKT